MRILIVKLSSLGDVVHAMPAVQDIRQAMPHAMIDWVVEEAFAPLVRRCTGIDQVIVCHLRAWRRDPFAPSTRAQWRHFIEQLRLQKYDAVIDLQGLTKSAFVARMARLTDRGRRFAMANRTEGSSYEAPTRWLADVAIPLMPRVHAVERSRLLCARALEYSLVDQERYGLVIPAEPSGLAEGSTRWQAQVPTVVFAHGSSRTDKQWPADHWIELGKRFNQMGLQVAFPHGSQAEQECGESMAEQLQAGQVWPRLSLDHLLDAMASCVGVIGVDSGLSHLAVALDLPHVQLYNLPTAWRTGPVGQSRQRSLQGAPCPAVEEVWRTWLEVVRS